MKKKTWPETSKEDREAIQRMLDETDWDKFWADVGKKCEPQIEAYRRARAESYAKSFSHVFL